MTDRGKLKSGEPRKRDKSKYKVKNWSEYNQSLKKRGMISLYFPRGDIKEQFINSEPYREGNSGQERTYLNPYIELLFTLYRLLGFGIRQITGFIQDLWRSKGLDIGVPSFGHLCDLFSSLPLKTKQFCNNLSRKLKSGESIDLVVDSSGLRFAKASYWYETKYNKPCNNKPWKKLHIGMDLDMNIHNVEITDCSSSDISVLDDIIPKDIAIDNLYADGAYYSINKVEELYTKGITPVIPPPKNACIHGKDNTRFHDKIVQYINDKGTIYAFYKKYGYGNRELVEAQFSRIKRCIGSTLLTQKTESQKTEGTVISNIINLWNSFGRCESVKIG
jgi:hypothetical protein